MSTANQPRSITTDVAIVGGGPVGVALAILLAKRGIRSVVVERHANVYPLPRAVHLDDEVYRILEDLGVGDEFAAISRPVGGLRLVDKKHRTIAQFDRAELSASGLPEANFFDQPELEELLRAEFKKHPEAVGLFGWTATGFEEDGDAVELRATSDGDEAVVRAAYLVGCDGANSWTRGRLGVTVQDLGFEQRWLVIDGRTDDKLEIWGGADQICDPDRPGTFMRVVNDRYRWEFRLDHDEKMSLWDEAAVRELLEPWTSRAGNAPLELVRIAEYTFRAEVAETWRVGRVFLAGDAAHLTPPFIGQGLGAGLRDVTNLAWKLAAVLQGRSSDALLDSYQAERKPHAIGLIRKAMMIGTVMTGRQAPAVAVRRGLMPIAARIRPVGEKILSSTTPAFAPMAGSSKRSRRDLAGSLAPRIPVADSGAAAVPLDRLVRDPLVLISVDGAAPASTPGLHVISISRADVLGGRRLADWLRRGGSEWAIVRPDRTVLASGKNGELLNPQVAEIVAALTSAAAVPGSPSRPRANG